MEDAIKDLSIEELMKIVELAQKEIDRRTIKVVDQELIIYLIPLDISLLIYLKNLYNFI